MNSESEWLLFFRFQAYDKLIHRATEDLEKALESDAHQLHKPGVKPQIKQPESRRLWRQNKVGCLSQSSSEISSPSVIISGDKSNLYFRSESSKSGSSQDEEKATEPFKSSTSEQSVVESIHSLLQSSTSSSVVEDAQAEVEQRVVWDETFVVERSDDNDGPSEREWKDDVTPEKLAARDVAVLADAITEALMAEMLSDSISSFRSMSRRREVSEVTDNVEVRRQPDGAACDIANTMIAKLFADAFETILHIHRKDRKVMDIGTQIHPTRNFSSSVSERVDMILCGRQDTSPREDRHRPQDLMVLSPLLAEDSEDLLASENFPFTDAFKYDTKVRGLA